MNLAKQLTVGGEPLKHNAVEESELVNLEQNNDRIEINQGI